MLFISLLINILLESSPLHLTAVPALTGRSVTRDPRAALQWRLPLAFPHDSRDQVHVFAFKTTAIYLKVMKNPQSSRNNFNKIL